MKKAKYINYPFSYLSLVLFFLICFIILMIFKEYWGGIISLAFGFLVAIPFIIFRKQVLKKMLINETEIVVYYKNQIVKKLKWVDIKYAQYQNDPHGHIFTLSDKPLYEKREAYKNIDEINIRTNSKFIIEFYKFAYKIPVPIKEIDKMPDYVIHGINKYKDQTK